MTIIWIVAIVWLAAITFALLHIGDELKKIREKMDK